MRKKVILMIFLINTINGVSINNINQKVRKKNNDLAKDIEIYSLESVT
ncbi:hypothetical protein [uncultured Clostridium sp.]|jgi:hypothetical protein|nr:hypothetical protein [uncultured Clostridium sp.]